MALNLACSALLVIDMQIQFEGIAGHLVPRLLPLIKLYHSKGLPVYFTQHGHLPDDRGSLVRRWGPPGKGSILRFADDWKLIPGLDDEKIAPLPSRIIDKTTYNAFLETSLEGSLRTHGVDTVVITGTLANLCCETTARDASCRNFNVVIIDDGCAAAEERHHRATLENLEFGFAEVSKIGEVIKEVRRL